MLSVGTIEIEIWFDDVTYTPSFCLTDRFSTN